MGSIYISAFKTAIGELLLGDFEGQLCMMDWKYRSKRNAIDARIQQYLNADFVSKETDLHREAKQQMAAYLSGERKAFNLPITFAGSDFQQKVWTALMEIPYGQTCTYLALSQSLNNPKAVRAVAAANGANALSIIVPCHRVIGSNGALIGYAGGLPAKEKLLQLEGALHQNLLF